MLASIRTDAAGELEFRGISSGNDVDELSLDCIFDVLKSGRRRGVIRQLAEADGDVAFSELVDVITMKESGSDEVDSRTRKAVYTSLYQSHLPKLADVDIVRYDRRSGPVSPGPRFDAVFAHLRLVEATRGARGESRGVARKGLDAVKAAVGLASEASSHADEATGE